MAYTTLIEAAELAARLEDPDWAIVDCRFTLGDAARGRNAYRRGHVPGAVYAHLDEDLSSPLIPGKTGRHPLPEVEELAARFSQWGIARGVQVVAYDDATGALAAARLWWLLRWLGHEAVAVLDGGWRAWREGGYLTRSGVESRSARRFLPRLRPEMVVSSEEVLAMRGDPTCRIVDARAADRYRGENETIDPVAGHIPGAISAPYLDNLDAQGRFLPPEALRARFLELLGGAPPSRAAFYCGSGVTAAHDLLALAHAGLGEGRLYAGSWSEWIVDPARPIALGAGTS